MTEILKRDTAKITVWPSPQDYNEAVQNLATAFTDPVLKSGEAELSPLGLPKPISGAFASVYRVHTDEGDWALRCFLHNMPDQQERYSKISEHLEGLQQSPTLPFEYEEQGVLLHGRFFPILKMQWLEGLHLDDYVEANLRHAKVLDALCADWKVMLGWLQENGIAHGDLQHGNIIMDKNELKLVDYDGMFVPSLSGSLSNELGHRNYQHPQRRKEHFGPWLDNFSAWSIYCSLFCLSKDPGLWQQLAAGDECLLFRQEDYKDPLHSRAFYLLEQHESEHVRDCARLLRSFLALPIDKVPGLDAAVHAPMDLPYVSGPAKGSSTSNAGRGSSDDSDRDEAAEKEEAPWYVNPNGPFNSSNNAHSKAGTQLNQGHGSVSSGSKYSYNQTASRQKSSTNLFANYITPGVAFCIALAVFVFATTASVNTPRTTTSSMQTDARPMQDTYRNSRGVMVKLAPFSKVNVSGNGKVEIEIEPGVEPMFSGNPLLEQTGDELNISTSGEPVKLVVKSLETVTTAMSDSGEVTVNGVNAPMLHVSLYDNGSLTVAGKTDNARIEVVQGAKAYLNDLRIRNEADVLIRKNGTVNINVSNTLRAMVAHDGRLLYKFAPQNTQRETSSDFLNLFSPE